jgi:hypothetical protein
MGLDLHLPNGPHPGCSLGVSFFGLWSFPFSSLVLLLGVVLYLFIYLFKTVSIPMVSTFFPTSLPFSLCLPKCILDF